MRGFIFCIAAALPAIACAAQPAPIEVKTVTYNGSLPYVVSANPKRDARINHSIFFGFTGRPAPAKYTDGVKVPQQEQNELPSASEIEYSITRADERVLAFEFKYEGCGAYCEPHWENYNFDAATGQAFSLSDIFTPQGRTTLFNKDRAKRVEEYRKAIAGLNKEGIANRKKQHISTPWPQPRTDNKQDDEEARISETIEMYQHCVESMRAPDYASYFTDIEFPARIDETSITFLYGRCSNHAMRALDDVGDQAITHEIAELAPFLTAYGKYLLMGGPRPALRVEPYRQFLQGHVGKAAITLQLARPGNDGAVTGDYFYDKYRKPIPLSGKVSGNTIELTESESTESPKPLIRATIKGDRLEGQWIGGKTLDFSVSP